MHDGMNLFILQGFMNRLFPAGIPVVGCGSMPGIHGKELTLDVGDEVINPVDGFDIRVAKFGKRSLVDHPLVK